MSPWSIGWILLVRVSVEQKGQVFIELVTLVGLMCSCGRWTYAAMARADYNL